jgi:hypothetical protein
VNPESDIWIEDLKATLNELLAKKYRLSINVDRDRSEIWIMENIWSEDRMLNLKFVGTRELEVRIEPILAKRHIDLIVNLIAKYLTNGILDTIEYVTKLIINDQLAPTTKIEFLI